MKNTHRTVIGVFGVLALSTAAFGNMALAQSAPASVELAQLVPADTDQLIELNTSAANPLKPFMGEMFSNFNLAESGTMSAEDRKTVEDIVTRELTANKLSIATKQKMVKSTYSDYSYPETETYASMHMTADDYNKLVSLFGTDVTKDTVDGMTVYTNSSDLYVTMIGDLVVAASTRERMTTLLDMYTNKTGATLAQTSAYTSARAKDLQGSFLNMFINPAQYQDVLNEAGSTDMPPVFMGLMTAEKDLMAALNAEGVSVGQTTTGFNFSVFIKGDQTKLTQLNLNFDRYNFIPELYKYVNSQNLMLFGEESNLKAKFQDFSKLFLGDATASKEFTDWKNNFRTDSDIDFDNDILPLLGGKYSMTVHKTGQIYPAVTLVIDVRSMSDKAANILTKLVMYANKSFNKMEQEQGVDFFNSGTATFNGTTFYEITLDTTKSADADQQLKNLPREKVVFNFHAAVTTQGFLIISTAPNVADVTTVDGKGMLNNANFSNAFTAPNESTAGIGFISMDGIKGYADSLMTDLAAPAEIKDFTDGLLSPWHDMYTKAYATPDSTWATGFVNVDTNGFAQYPALIEKMFTMGVSQDFTPPVPTLTGYPKTFCDVHPSDWYAEYVNDLAQNKIVGGYNDGCFKPAREITRAEFIKMALTAKEGISLPTFETKNYFKDIRTDESEWYNNSINYAASQQLIGGYSDGTFRPNAPITRAEAVQVLYKMGSTIQQIDNLTQFNDVHPSDWFMEAIAAAYNNGLVSGTTSTTFEPNRNINRAEAAKIIKLFRDLEIGGMANQPGMLRTIDYTQQTNPTEAPNVY